MHTTIVPTADGFDLHATTFGDSARCRAAVLIAPGMGVEQDYYAPFARWLAQQGYFVATFDSRGIGRSRLAAFRDSLRGFEADVLTWARRDCAAMVDRVADRCGGRPLLWIGHSPGGQSLGVLPNRERVRAMVTIAAGSGYWRENSPGLRRIVGWLWYVLVPLTLPLYGDFPGRMLRKVGDLPAGVMRQWRDWCLNRDSLAGHEGGPMRRRYAAVTTPILSLSFTDDELMSRAKIESLHGFYSGAPRRMTRIDPREIGERRIGHFGFFRKRYAPTLWPRALDFLEQSA